MITDGFWEKESPFSLRTQPLLAGPFSSGRSHTHEHPDNKNNIKLEGAGVDPEGVRGRSEDE